MAIAPPIIKQLDKLLNVLCAWFNGDVQIFERSRKAKKKKGEEQRGHVTAHHKQMRGKIYVECVVSWRAPRNPVSAVRYDPVWGKWHRGRSSGRGTAKIRGSIKMKRYFYLKPGRNNFPYWQTSFVFDRRTLSPLLLHSVPALCFLVCSDGSMSRHLSQFGLKTAPHLQIDSKTFDRRL